MTTAILLALLILAACSIVLALVAMFTLLESNRGYRELVLAQGAQHADDREYLLRAVVGKHAGEVAYLTRVDDAVDVEAQRAQLRERALFDLTPRAERDPETHEEIHLVGMGG